MLTGPVRPRGRRGQRRRDDVADVYVVAGLAAVAEDGRAPAGAQQAAEDRDHARLAERVLARAVDVAEPQRDGREPVEALEERQVALGRELALAVGRERRDRRRLVERQLLAFALAVDRAAGGDEDDPSALGAARRLEHVGGAADVDGGVEGRVDERLADVDLGGQVEDRLGSLLAAPGRPAPPASRMSSSTSSAPAASPASRLERRPVERSSTTVTSSPRDSRASTRFEPMNPAPPVTKHFISVPILEGSARGEAERAAARPCYLPAP